MEKFRFKWPGNDVPATIDGDLLNRLLDGYDIRPQTPHPELKYTSFFDGLVITVVYALRHG